MSQRHVLRITLCLPLSIALLASCAPATEEIASDYSSSRLVARRADRAPALSDSHQGSEAVLLSDPIVREEGLLLEEHSAVRDVRVDGSRITYRVAGENPVEEGTVVGGAAGGGYIRLVEAVEIDGDRVTLTTSEAGLNDLFEELDLAIAYRPRRQARRAVGTRSGSWGRRSEALSASGECHDITPCEASGSADERELRGRSSARSSNCEFGAEGDVEVDASLEVNFDADFRLRVRRKFDFYLETRGTADAEVTINGQGSLEGSCNADFAEELFPNAPWTLLRFTVAGIPGRLYAYPILDGSIEASAQGTFQVGFTAHAHDNRTVGWKSAEWTNENDTDFEFTPIAEAEASADVQGNLRVGVGLGVTIGADLFIVAAKGTLETRAWAEAMPHFQIQAEGDLVAGSLDCPASFALDAAVKLEAYGAAELGLLWWRWTPEDTWGPWEVWSDRVIEEEWNWCDSAPECTPTMSCEDFGCGIHTDDCGAEIDCGACEPDCEPRTCVSAGASCGLISDGCGGSLDCGECDRYACFEMGEGWCPDDAACSTRGMCVLGEPVFG